MLRWKGLLPTTLAAVLLAAAPATAATFTVVGTGDEVGNCHPDTLVCDSVRTAILYATDSEGPDTIMLPAGDIQLDQALQIITDVTLVGRGTRQTKLIGSAQKPTEAIWDNVIWVDNARTATISHVTLTGGKSEISGGNVLNRGTLTLDHVRVVDGDSDSGPGGGILNNGRLTVTHSYIGGNSASDGSAVANQLYEAPDVTLSIADSTIAGNVSSGPGAIYVQQSTSATLDRVTITGNNTSLPTGVGAGIQNDGGSVSVSGSIVAGNVAGNATVDCQGAIVSGGGNVSTSACGFEQSGLTPAQLIAARDSSGETEVYPLLAGSPALDRYACTGSDQRGETRPQGAACDAGAYELTVAPPDPTPTPTPTPSPTPTAAPPVATPTPVPPVVTPTPTFNQTVVVEPERGTIRIRRRGSDRFVPLGEETSIPFGSTVDAGDGRVELRSRPNRDGSVQTAIFYAGQFKVVRAANGYTELQLNEPLAPCGSSRTRRAAASAAAAKKKPATRRLWGSGKGKFRTKGRYSAATVRGTKWMVEDGCRYTRTRVTQGSVSVRDSVRRRTVIRRAGQSYTARPR